MNATVYAHAFVGVVIDGKKDVGTCAERLTLLMKRNGDWPKRNKIIAACEAELRRREGRHLLEIESAHALGDVALGILRREFPEKSYDYKTSVNAALIGGARMTIDETQEYDATLARMVRNMFHKL